MWSRALPGQGQSCCLGSRRKPHVSSPVYPLLCSVSPGGRCGGGDGGGGLGRDAGRARTHSPPASPSPSPPLCPCSGRPPPQPGLCAPSPHIRSGTRVRRWLFNQPISVRTLIGPFDAKPPCFTLTHHAPRTTLRVQAVFLGSPSVDPPHRGVLTAPGACCVWRPERGFRAGRDGWGARAELSTSANSGLFAASPDAPSPTFRDNPEQLL